MLNERVDELKDVLIEDINKVVERGDRLEKLVQSTDDLAQSGRIFRKGAVKVKRSMIWKLVLLVIIIIIIALVIIAVVVLVIIAAVCPRFQCQKV